VVVVVVVVVVVLVVVLVVAVVVVRCRAVLSKRVRVVLRLHRVFAVCLGDLFLWLLLQWWLWWSGAAPCDLCWCWCRHWCSCLGGCVLGHLQEQCNFTAAPECLYLSLRAQPACLPAFCLPACHHSLPICMCAGLRVYVCVCGFVCASVCPVRPSG
jgi:hypothetical protein